MSRLRDNSFVKTMSVRVRFTAEEYERLEQHRIRVRAPNMAGFAREIILRSLNAVPIQCLDSASIVPDCKDNKESNKEKKEITPTPTHEKNAHTHARDLNFYVSWITDNASQRPLAEEFLRGRLAAGEDLEQKGATELKKHFGRWLPKYQAKMEIAARRNGVLQDQNLAKREREAMSAAQQRQLDENLRAAQSPEAQAERDRVLSKFGKPWKRKETNRKL